jgi:hypothetical protein
MTEYSPPPTTPTPSFDQIVKGDVSIKKLSKHKYKITFSKIGKFLMYQVWDKDNVGQQNDKRAVFNLSAKEWVNNFMKLNKFLKKDNKPLFTPTTIMETADEVAYAIVIHKAYFDSHDRVVFTVSTKEIQLANNTSNDLINIPSGKFKNMRFDIDNVLSSNINTTIFFLPEGTTTKNNPRSCFLTRQFSLEQAFLSFSDPDRRWYIGVPSIPRSQLEIGKDYYVDQTGQPYTYACSRFLPRP